MHRVRNTMIVALFAGLIAAPAAAQMRDRYDNSLDMRAPLSRQQGSNAVVNNPPRTLPDNCYTGVATDRTVGCVAPNRAAAPLAPLPTVPCTPKGEIRNPALGPLPNTCN